MEEEGARAVEHLRAVRARRPPRHVAAALTPVLGGFAGGALCLLLQQLVYDIKRSLCN